ncbi:MAG: MerR family transcriptional regulator [Bacteroidales bacterium]
MAVYSIRELEKLSGIKAHTLRMWEKRYDLIEPRRTTTNIRYYTDGDLKRILSVAMLNRHGIKISHIARLNELELKEEILRLNQVSTTFGNLIDSLVMAMIDFDEYKLNALIESAIARAGFHQVTVQVLFPFLAKVGILWQSGEVNPAQEHFVSGIIRQKVISQIDRLPVKYEPGAKRFLLILPEGEWHELSLLFTHFMLKEAGQHVIYLGQSVPYADVLATGASLNFDALVVASTTSQSEFNFGTYLKELGVAFPDKLILYFSRSLQGDIEGLGDQHHQIPCDRDFSEFILSL